jgi:hypothetical protein
MTHGGGALAGTREGTREGLSLVHKNVVGTAT